MPRCSSKLYHGRNRSSMHQAWQQRKDSWYCSLFRSLVARLRPQLIIVGPVTPAPRNDTLHSCLCLQICVRVSHASGAPGAAGSRQAPGEGPVHCQRRALIHSCQYAHTHSLSTMIFRVMVVLLVVAFCRDGIKQQWQGITAGVPGSPCQLHSRSCRPTGPTTPCRMPYSYWPHANLYLLP